MDGLECTFWNVGQGLFSSGKVSLDNNKEFIWVYDCGTSSSQKLLSSCISKMKREYPNEYIDLLAISHFDKDHISGIKELLKNYKIKQKL